MLLRNITVSPVLGSPAPVGLRAHICVTLDGAGKPCRVDCDVAKIGSAAKTALQAHAALATLALQHGAPLADVVDELRAVAADPCGDVFDHETIRSATSLADLMGQVLAEAAGGVR